MEKRRNFEFVKYSMFYLFFLFKNYVKRVFEDVIFISIKTLFFRNQIIN